MMPNEIFERAAEAAFDATVPFVERALGEDAPPVQRWRDLAPKAAEREIYRAIVRATLEAIREPSEAMCEAGRESDLLEWSLESGEGLDAVNVDNAWRAMVDVILSPRNVGENRK